MATDAKKHTTIAAGEKPTRTALAAAILSVNDVIPVANAIEATQVVVALAAMGQPIASNPVAVARADARGMHRIEITWDPQGLVWTPISGIPTFASKTAADNWGAANSALLSVSDECMIGGGRYKWDGTAWGLMGGFRTFSLARGGMTDNQTFFQVPVEDTAKATVPSFNFVYNGADGRITPDAGIYLLHVKAHPGGVTTGSSFVQLRGTAQGLLARGNVSINADPWMTCSAIFRADGTEGFIIDIQKQTGGASAGSGALHMTKLSTL